MKFDDILSQYVGDFGRFQKIQIFLVCLPTLFLSMHSISWTFTGRSSKQRCILPYEKDQNFTSYYSEDANFMKWCLKDDKKSQCYRPAHYGLAVDNSTINFDLTSFGNFSTKNLEPCLDGYVFDTSEIASSAVTRWGFYCEWKVLKPFVHSCYYIGQFFGSYVFGTLADKFGRKPVFFMAIFIQVICGIGMAFVPYWWLFALFRFCLGFAHPAVYVTAIVVAVEMLGPSKRMISTVSATIAFAVGQICLAIFGYFFRHYDQLQLIISAPVIIFIAYYWLVPESARWLVNRGRIDEAEKILRKVAKWNKKTLPDGWPAQLKLLTTDSKCEKNKEEKKKTAGFLDMFRTPNIRKNTLTLFLCWPIVSMAYYGLAMNPNFMGGDPYVTMAFGGFSEILVSILLSLTMNALGRKFYGVIGFCAAALSLAASALIPQDFQTARMVCVVFGKMSIAAVYGILYTYTPELFPTEIRMTAVGACSMIARFGGITASYVFLWITDYYPALVALSLSATSLMAACLFLLLPDTNGQGQFETIEEAENFAKKKQKLFLFSWNLEKMAEKERQRDINMSDVKTIDVKK